MDDSKPPSYESSLASGVSAAAPCINKGYEEDAAVSKPPTAPPLDSRPHERAPFISFGVLTDKDLRDACYRYIEDHCCYGTRFIKKMVFADIFNSYTFHYKMESFGEMRESEWTSTSYYGQDIDGPENGPVPRPWDMRVRTPTKFKDDRTYKEMPHTASVKTCSTCGGDGRVRCSSCSGDGYDNCYSCSGRGRDSEGERCSSCSGTGRKTCWRCDGRGRVDCSPCSGRGKLKHYKELIVTWRNHVDNFISDSMNLPKELILGVTGKEVFKEQDQRVLPISHIPDITVNGASASLVEKHRTAFRNEQILEQRHTLWAVPLTRATYVWKDKQGEFYVYGFQKKVYFEEYPQQCCCCTCC